ncbi:MAG: 30S ribosomal protein S8 [Nitrospirae bacterium]|nr:30S ribosomal protein S8 [Nitrospirota bacterium]
MNTDPIADLLTRIRNASRAHHATTHVPHSKLKENVLEAMKGKAFISDYKVETDKKNFKSILITLNEDKSDLTIKRVSSPGQRIYIKNEDLKPIKSGLGITIISTSKGVMTNIEAKKQNLGGELLCEIY